jgi:hypothetical protein
MSAVQLSAANLLAMMADPTNPLQTYFASLPTREELLSPLVSMPEEYLPLLQSDLAVSLCYAWLVVCSRSQHA